LIELIINIVFQLNQVEENGCYRKFLMIRIRYSIQLKV